MAARPAGASRKPPVAMSHFWPLWWLEAMRMTHRTMTARAAETRGLAAIREARGLTQEQLAVRACLAELDAAAKAARAAEDEARREQQARQRRVTEAKAELTRAAATGEGVEDAEKALQAAQEAAGDLSLPARIEGLAQATRRAEQAAQGFVEPNLHELIEALAPRALASVDGIVTAAAELERAIAEWNDAASEVSRVGGRVPWFAKKVSRSVPSGDLFGEIRGALERLRMNPPPPPLPTARIEDPGQEQERLQREHQEEVERRRAMRTSRASGVQWDHPYFGDAA